MDSLDSCLSIRKGRLRTTNSSNFRLDAILDVQLCFLLTTKHHEKESEESAILLKNRRIERQSEKRQRVRSSG